MRIIKATVRSGFFVNNNLMWKSRNETGRYLLSSYYLRH